MSSVLNRTTKQLLLYVNTPDYSTDDWIIDPDLSKVSGLPVKYWKINGDSVDPMSQEERDAVDAAELPLAKALRIKELNIAANSYIDAHYDSGEKASLLAAWVEGVQLGYTNRNAMIQSVWNWAKSIIDYFSVKVMEINNAASLAAVSEVKWDFSQFDATDPQVTVYAVKSTTN